MTAEHGVEGPPIARPLREDEKALYFSLLEACGSLEKFRAQVADGLFRDMDDGGMGSLQAVMGDDIPRSFGQRLVEATYTDADGVSVSIAVHLDDRGDLYEIDMWKIDFSPLCQYPTPDQLAIEAVYSADAQTEKPVVVIEGNDLSFFPTRDAAAAYVEPVDVEKGAYFFFEADGTVLKASVSLEVRHYFFSLLALPYRAVQLRPTGKKAPDVLKEHLRAALSARGVDGTSLELSALFQRAMKEF